MTVKELRPEKVAIESEDVCPACGMFAFVIEIESYRYVAKCINPACPADIKAVGTWSTQKKAILAWHKLCKAIRNQRG